MQVLSQTTHHLVRLQLLTCTVEGEETGSLDNYQVYPAFLVILNLQTATLTSGKRQKKEEKDVNHLTVLSVTIVNKRLRLWHCVDGCFTVCLHQAQAV